MNNHPFKCVFNDTSSLQLFLNRPSVSAPFYLRAREEASNLGFSFLDLYKSSFTDLLPPWHLRPVSCDTSFTQIQKYRVPRSAILQHFLSLQQKYQCAEFYSDASKTATAVSCAAHGPNVNICKTMKLHCSIFTAEAHGVLLILNPILQN